MDSFVCNNPESGDLLGVKRENQKNCQYYCFLLIKSDINKSKIGSSRTLEHTLRIQKMHNRFDREAKETIKDISILPVRLICRKLSMAVVHPTLNVYRTFCGIPKHIFAWNFVFYQKKYRKPTK